MSSPQQNAIDSALKALEELKAVEERYETDDKEDADRQAANDSQIAANRAELAKNKATRRAEDTAPKRAKIEAGLVAALDVLGGGTGGGTTSALSVLAEHPTLWFDDARLARLATRPKEDGAAAGRFSIIDGTLEHQLKKGQFIHPLHDEEQIKAPLPAGTQILLFCWEMMLSDPFQDRDGKLIGGEGGAGASGGKTHMQNGIPGCSIRGMHPNGGGFGGYAYYKNKSGNGNFGIAFTDKNYQLPKSRFVTVGVGAIFESDEGKQDGQAICFADGRVLAGKNKVEWPRAAWFQQVRIMFNFMNGGNPQDLPPKLDCRQRFRNGRVLTSTERDITKVGVPT